MKRKSLFSTNKLQLLLMLFAMVLLVSCGGSSKKHHSDADDEEDETEMTIDDEDEDLESVDEDFDEDSELDEELADAEEETEPDLFGVLYRACLEQDYDYIHKQLLKNDFEYLGEKEDDDEEGHYFMFLHPTIGEFYVGMDEDLGFHVRYYGSSEDEFINEAKSRGFEETGDGTQFYTDGHCVIGWQVDGFVMYPGNS